MIEINDTISLIRATEQIKPPATFLSDLFFPSVEVSPTPTIMMEYRKRGRDPLAPYVVEGSKGVNVKRAGSTMRVYSPPMLAPKRMVTQTDVMRRGFGEMPYFSTVSAEERAAKLQADDLADLVGMIANRKNQMASELLTTGKITIDGYDDAGYKQRIDEVQFEHNADQVIMVQWSNANSKIYEDLQAMSETIQEEAGLVPTVLVVGKNVPGYLLKNTTIKEWLMIPNRQTGSYVAFNPTYQSPQVQYIGQITALNLEIYCYNETYVGDDGSLKRYVGENDVIMGVPGRGTCQHAAIPLVMGGQFQTYAAPYVPKYTVNEEENLLMLTVWSKMILVPNYACDWVHATVAT